MNPALPISRLIGVSVNLSPAGAQSQSLSDGLVLGSSDVIDVHERMRTYLSLSAIATDFGTNAPEYLSAALWFGQSPSPSRLLVGRWAKTDSKGKLVCGALSAVNSLVATWAAIASGGFTVAIDGGAAAPYNAINFTGAANLNGVATLITTALAGAATCVYNAAYNRFEFESATAGAASKVSFLTAGAATDISAMLGGTLAMGAYTADGIVAESAVAAATLFDNQFGQQFYGLIIPEAVNADHQAVAALIEGLNNKHLYGVSTQEAGVLSSVGTTDIAYILAQLKYKRTGVQYSGNSAYSVASLLGRMLTVNWAGNNTAITLMFKQEPGIIPETLNATQIAALEAKNCNVFVAYNNNTAIIEPGIACSGDFIDTIAGIDWLAVTIQTALYNLLYTSPTKIPQTDAGAHLLVTTVESVCSQGVENGLLAPGTWTAAGFGGLSQNDFLAKGFYVYAPPVASQSPADRAARKSVPIQVAAKLAGAVHSSNVAITVNR